MMCLIFVVNGGLNCGVMMVVSCVIVCWLVCLMWILLCVLRLNVMCLFVFFGMVYGVMIWCIGMNGLC